MARRWHDQGTAMVRRWRIAAAGAQCDKNGLQRHEKHEQVAVIIKQSIDIGWRYSRKFPD